LALSSIRAAAARLPSLQTRITNREAHVHESVLVENLGQLYGVSLEALGLLHTRRWENFLPDIHELSACSVTACLADSAPQIDCTLIDICTTKSNGIWLFIGRALRSSTTWE
jgi:hypothetical protein